MKLHIKTNTPTGIKHLFIRLDEVKCLSEFPNGGGSVVLQGGASIELDETAMKKLISEMENHARVVGMKPL
jgi:hypothetical protein